MRRQEQWDASYTSRKWAGSCLAKRTFRRNTGRPVHVPGSDAFAALKPCAMTYHSEESLRLAGGLACLTLWELRFSAARSEEHTSELQSLMRISYAVFCLKKNKSTNACTS